MSVTDQVVSFPIGWNEIGDHHIDMSVFCSVVFDRNEFTSVSSASDHIILSTASLAPIIKVSSSMSTVLSTIVILASVLASATCRI